MASVESFTCAASAARNAARLTFLFTFSSKLGGVGGNATPPPVNCGARIVPARARPVPFWRHGFERPPATRPRLFAARVPARRAFSSARTVSWTRCGRRSAPKTASSSATSFEDWPPDERSGALGAATLLLANLDDAVLRPRNRALHEQEVPLCVDAAHREADLRDVLAAEAARHLLALEDARRRRRSADRARLADVVRSVARRPAVESVALDRAREPLADPDARDLHALARLEGLDRHGLADRELGRPAELDEVPVRRGLALAQVAEL